MHKILCLKDGLTETVMGTAFFFFLQEKNPEAPTELQLRSIFYISSLDLSRWQFSDWKLDSVLHLV